MDGILLQKSDGYEQFDAGRRLHRAAIRRLLWSACLRGSAGLYSCFLGVGTYKAFNAARRRAADIAREKLRAGGAYNKSF